MNLSRLIAAFIAAGLLATASPAPAFARPHSGVTSQHQGRRHKRKRRTRRHRRWHKHRAQKQRIEF
jgi:hypothetical protein